ncbi:MAG: diacylglycerol O-acyltransferase, partial [Patiriisocius sp.]
SLEPMAQYFTQAFDMLEACVDNPSLNVDDIGEKVSDIDNSVVSNEIYVQ